MCSEEATNEVADAMKGGGAASNASTQATTADPVNIVTGAFLQTETDLRIPCGRLSLEFTRHYDSGHHNASSLVGPMGRGWTHSYNLLLNVDDPHAPSYTDDRFSKTSFAPDESRPKTFIPFKRSGVELHSRGFGFTLRQGDGLEAHFSNEGKLLRFLRPGPKLDVTIDLDYDDRSRLSRIRGLGGRELRLGYEGSSNLVSVLADHTGREWRYTYSDDVLVRVERPDQAIIEYEYAAQGVRVASARRQTKQRKVVGMTKVFLPRLLNEDKVAMVTNRYTSEGRVHEQIDALGNVTSFDYNLFTRTTCVTDPAGFTTVYCYDEAGNTVKMRKPEGRLREWFFDDCKNLIAEIDWQANGLPSQTEYAEFSDVTSIVLSSEFGMRTIANRSDYVDTLRKHISKGFDQYGNRPLVRDARGNTTRFEDYTRFSQPLRIVLPDESTIAFDYDIRSGLPIRKYRRLSNGQGQIVDWVIGWSYDPWGNMIRRDEWTESLGVQVGPRKIEEYEVDTETHEIIRKLAWITTDESKNSLKSEQQFKWNSLGQMIGLTILRRQHPDDDPEHCTYSFAFNELGWQTSITNPENVVARIEFDLRGNKVGAWIDNRLEDEGDSRLEWSRWVYDIAGRCIEMDCDAGGNVELELDKRGLCIAKKYVLGCITRYEYDREGRQKLKITPRGIRRELSYDLAGKVLKIVESTGRSEEIHRDVLGRVSRIQYSDDPENKLEFCWDWAGRLESMRRPDGTLENFFYDERGNQISCDQCNSEGSVLHREQFVFDGIGRLIAIAAGKPGDMITQFRFLYDDINRKVKTIDAMDNATEAKFDSENNRVLWIDAESRYLFQKFDRVNRLIQRYSQDGDVDSSFAYDVGSRLVYAVDRRIANFSKYDCRGRILQQRQVVDGSEHLIDYEYDMGGRLAAVSMDADWWMKYTYIERSPFVSSIQMPQAVVDFTSDDCGRLIEEKWSSGELFAYAYSKQGMLSSVSCFQGENLVRLQCIKRDFRGRCVEDCRKADGDSTTFEFHYDQLNRLADMFKRDHGGLQHIRRYEFDSRGNRVSESRYGNLYFSHTYDSANRPIQSVDLKGKSIDYQHDRCGNRTATETDILTYDVLGRLREVSCKRTGQLKGKYEYSAIGNRVSHSTGVTQKTNIFIGHKRICEFSSNSRRHWFWTSNETQLLAIAGKGGKATALSSFGLLPCVLNDSKSNIGLIEDPYGNSEYLDRESTQLFQTKEVDPLVGWYDFHSRYLDSRLGRFTSPDLLGPVFSSNLYIFAENNPLFFYDEKGYVATNSPTSISAPLALPCPTIHLHHVFPQAHFDWFDSRNIDIHQFTVPVAIHQHLNVIHGRGLFPGADDATSVGRYNAVWDKFISHNPEAPREAVFAFASHIASHYGFAETGWGPYR